MPRHKDALTFAVNHAKYMVKHAETDTAQRWWFTRYIVLAGLVTIKLEDSSILNKGPQPQDEIDQKAKEMLRQLGGDHVGSV